MPYASMSNLLWKWKRQSSFSPYWIRSFLSLSTITACCLDNHALAVDGEAYMTKWLNWHDQEGR